MAAVIISIVVLILGCGVLYWIIGSAPFIGDPFKSFAQWAVLVLCVVWAFGMLLGYIPPFPLFFGGRR
jgi:hypothetical protein